MNKPILSTLLHKGDTASSSGTECWHWTFIVGCIIIQNPSGSLAEPPTWLTVWGRCLVTEEVCQCVSYCRGSFIQTECRLELKTEFVLCRSWGWRVSACFTVRAALPSVCISTSARLISATTPPVYHRSGERWHIAAWRSCLSCAERGHSGMNWNRGVFLPAHGGMLPWRDAYTFSYAVWCHYRENKHLSVHPP